MAQIPADQFIPFLIQTALLPILIVRIWFASLQRVYPYFFSYLVVSFVADLFPFSFPTGVRPMHIATSSVKR